ncbi:MAG: sulfatase-like hydrolase/transferase [Vulcanimicrobiota bacterium]
MSRFDASLGLGVLVVGLAILLDFNYRSSFLTLLGGWGLLVNLLVLLAFVLPIGALLGALLAGLGRMKSNEWSLGGAFLVIAYLCADHLKIFLNLAAGLSIPRATSVAVALLGLLLVAYPRAIRPNFEPDSFAWLGQAARFVWPATLLAGALAWWPGSANPAGFERPHVLILTSDSLSAEAFEAGAPGVKQWSRSATVLEHALTNANATKFAMPCFLGKLPAVISQPVGPLLESLRQAGYDQRTFISFFNVSPGFVNQFSDVVRVARAEQWFDFSGLASRQWLCNLASEDSRYWSLISQQSPADFNYGEQPTYPTRPALEHALTVFRQAQGPAVVWVHLFAPHHPFYLEGRWKEGPEDMPALYHRAVGQWDEEVAAFLKELDQRFPDTLVVLSSDHGESFGRAEGGWHGTLHGANWLNQDICHIPLIIKTPGQIEGRRLKTFASQIDVAPTLLELLGLELPPDLDGESLVPYFDQPDQLSQKIKICVPESYFLRHTLKIQDKPEAWVTGSEDMFAAFMGEFKVGWFQLYERGPDGYLNRYKDALIYGLYKPRSDPDLSHDLSKDPAHREVLVRVFNSPLVASYRHQGADGASRQGASASPRR